MIDPVAIQLGPLSIRWYALCIVSGVILAVYLAMKEGRKKGIKEDDILDFILIAFPFAILGARLYYVIFDWEFYASQPFWEIFAVWHGGIAIYGGLITGALVLYFFSKYRFINPIHFLDIVVPGVLIAQAIGRWGNFINQEAYGKAVAHLNYLPSWIRNQMFIDDAYRQPTFLYESTWNLLGFVLVLFGRRYLKSLRDGHLTAFYLVWYGCGRFVIEGMRTDSLMLAGMRVSQWLSIALVGLGLVIFLIQNHRQADYYIKTK